MSALRASRIQNLTWEVTIGGAKVYLTADIAEDGRCAGIWLQKHLRQSDAETRSWADLWALAFTKALRCGCSLDSLVDAYLFVRTDDGGVVQGDAQIKMATSIVDYVAKRLAIEFLGRDELANVRLPVERRREA